MFIRIINKTLAQSFIPKVKTAPKEGVERLLPGPQPILGWSNITGFLNDIISIAATLIIAIVIIYFLYSAFMYATAGGDASKAETAKNNLIYSLLL